MSVAATEPLVVPLLYDPSFKGIIMFSFNDLSDMHETETVKSVLLHVCSSTMSTLMQLLLCNYLSVYHLRNYYYFK